MRRQLRVCVAGAGNVGRSIARELLANGHSVLLMEREARAIKPDSVPGAAWINADACEINALEEAELATFDVMVAATGDDKANLVISLLAKTEYGVGRVVARVNHPKNEWLFDAGWGVDVAVSSPRLLTALVEEAVSVGDLVTLMSFRQSDASLVELTLDDDAPLVGQTLGSIDLPDDCAIVTILRAGRVVLPSPETTLEAGDEVLAVTTTPEAAVALEDVLGRTPSEVHGLSATASTPGL